MGTILLGRETSGQRKCRHLRIASGLRQVAVLEGRGLSVDAAVATSPSLHLRSAPARIDDTTNKQEGRAVRLIASLVLVALSTPAFAQSLGDVARKEKKRREANERQGASVRVITDDEVGRARASSSSAPELVDTDVVANPELEPDGMPLAPDYTHPDKNGRSYSLADFRGKPVLVDFWASWCGPCKATMPEIERLHRKYRPRLQVIGINIEGNSPDVLAYLDQGGYSFRVLFDGGNWEGVVARSYGVTSIPRTFLIDAEGRVLFSGHPNRLREEQIQAALRQ
jgi:thiol-disulfide isomerase/thioredoxin